MIRCERANLNMLELPVSVKEIRLPRFDKTRTLKTPLDIFQLWKVF